MNKLKILSLFSGVGAFEKSLTNIGKSYELVNYCEIDKYAATAYSAIHNVSEDLNLGDITKIDIQSLSGDIDIITHGSPCQSFSISGKQEGGDEGSGTRSSLMWNTVEIIKHTKPKYVLWENVPNVLSDAHKHNYNKYIDTLDKIGYQNYSQLINAKYWGVPQNRKRIFVVSIRKDIDNGFNFPISSLEGQISLFNDMIEMEETILRDVLEDEVDEKYYLSDEALEYMNRKVEDGRTHWDFGLHHEADKPSHAIVANIRKGVPYNVVKIPIKGTYNQNEGFKEKNNFDTLDASYYKGLGCNQDRNAVLELQQIGDNSIEDEPKIYQKPRGYNKGGLKDICPTISINSWEHNNYLISGCKIRRLTPLECFRLMGFDDEDYYKARKVLEEKYYNGSDRSDSQCYKMAGNSIVVPVLEYIFKALFHL
ncbi:MAG: DNA (cytosine-5-)-methyltransferase [bacterium]